MASSSAARVGEEELVRKENKFLRKEVKQLRARLNELERAIVVQHAQPGKLSRSDSMDLLQLASFVDEADARRPLEIIVFGASGDLAKKKTFPSLFGIFSKQFLPDNVSIMGYARSAMTDDELRERIREHLPPRTSADDDEEEEIRSQFLKRIRYVRGQYDDLSTLVEFLRARAAEFGRANRMFYLALPPSAFGSTLAAVRHQVCDAVELSGGGCWRRIVIEKPFGRDSASSAALQNKVAALFTEQEVYRIDHYLGKEIVQNLIVTRFCNVAFQPLWNRNHIDCVIITLKEDFGTEGRAGYFDTSGIIRDVVENHCLQVLSLVAMEQPVSLSAEDIRNEKVKVLRSIPPLTLQDVVIGQYSASELGCGYLQEDGVPADSVTPTFAACRFYVNNPRWDGVPFIIKCGKALNERKAEVRIQFRQPPGQLFSHQLGRNELIQRIQPNEAVLLRVINKKPGLTGELAATELDLTYKSRFELAVADAYERLILDVVRGDQSLFVRDDELEVAWQIFTPLLHTLEQQRIKPLQYPRGSRGPSAADDLIRQCGYVYHGTLPAKL
jgi:glucose-6-phosphate 1-dehydrogenase